MRPHLDQWKLRLPAAVTTVFRGRFRFLFLSFLIVAFGSASQGLATTDDRRPSDLASELEDAFAERNTDLSGRLELVRRLDQFFASQYPSGSVQPQDADFELWLKTRFVEAVTHLRLNQLEKCFDEVNQLIGHLDATRYPELTFRCRSVEASLMLMRGDRTGSVEAHERLLAGNLENIPNFLVDRARINYAAALNENGQVHATIEMYEMVVLDALEKKNDKSAIHAGNNLVSILLGHGDAITARHAISELQPVMERNRGDYGVQSLRLRELELLRIEGKQRLAAIGLGQFVARVNPPPPPLFLGVAHRLLAETLSDLGDLEQALEHSEEAIELLQNNANETTNVYLTHAQVLLKMQEYQRVLDTLQKIPVSKELVPSRRKLIYQIGLEAKLRLDSRTEEADALIALIQADNDRQKLYTQSTSDYFESKLEAIHRRLEAQQAESHAFVVSQTKQAESRFRYFLTALLAIGGIGGSSLVYVNWRRQAERRRLEEQEAQNSKLELLVAEKTRELAAQLQSQAEMAKALERKRRIESVGLLAGNVAHDINNLLQVISNSNETLNGPDLTEEDRKQAILVSNESLKHGSGIIRQLLAYSRQQNIESSVVAVREFLDDCHPLFQSAVGELINLVIRGPQEEVYVLVDPSQLTTSLLNILGNAADAMPNGGTIIFEVSLLHWTASKDPWPRLGSGQYVCWKIQDHGCGMDPEQLSRAFEPFYSTKGVGKGSGLGLCSAQSFINQNAGDIRIESKPSLGTTVEFLLPSVAPPSSPPIPVAIDHGHSIASKRILLVEDNEDVAKSLMTLLKHIKLKASWVASGDEAVQLLSQDHQFDYLLSDVHMPGNVDGAALAVLVKDTYPAIQVMLMSGYHEIAPDYLDVPLLPKPFSIRQLSEILERGNPMPR